MLVSRKAAKEQFSHELGEQSVIHVETYQHYQAKLKKGLSVDLSEFAFLVGDEFHYLLSDSPFNHDTDLSFDLMVNQPGAIKIFLSATSDKATRFIEATTGVPTINYTVPSDFSHVRSLTFFKNKEKIDHFALQAIERGEKAIFFLGSVENACKLYESFSDNALFYCSQDNPKKYLKHVDEARIKDMLVNERFDCNLLITTCVLDTAVNLSDKAIRHIVTDIYDPDTVTQCMGRRRFDYDDPSDTVSYYLFLPNSFTLGSVASNYQKSIKMANYLLEHGEDEFVSHYGTRLHDPTQTIYYDYGQNKVKINQLKFNDKIYRLDEINSMRENGNTERGYRKLMCERLIGDSNYQARILQDSFDLLAFCDAYVDKPFSVKSDVKKELVRKIGIREYGHFLHDYETLAQAFIRRDLPYRLNEFKDKKTRKVFWQITKLATTCSVDTSRDLI